MEQQLMNTKELAKYLGLHTNTVYNMLNRGMPSFWVGGRRRYELQKVMAWIQKKSDSNIKGHSVSESDFLEDFEAKMKEVSNG